MMCMLNALAHQSSMQEIDLLNPQLDRRIAFSRASTSTFFGADGLLQSASVDAWPAEYDPTTLEPVGRSVWDQRTNLALNSGNFAAWPNNLGITVVSGASTGADGLLSMDKLVEDTSTGVHKAQQNFTVPSAVTNYAFSGTAKAGERTQVRFGAEAGSSVIWNGGTVPQAVFDLTTGAVVSKTSAATYAAAKALPGGVWLLEVRAQSSGTGGIVGLAYVLLSGGSLIYTGDGASGLYAGTAQLEQALSAGPYIPTAGSQVTRARDVPDLSTLDGVRFNQTRGQTVLLEYEYNHGGNFTLAQIHDGDAALDTEWLIYSNNNPDTFIARMYGGAGSAGAHFGGSFASVRGAAPNRGVVAADQVSTSGVLNIDAIKSNTNCIPPTSGLVGARLGQLLGGSSVLNGHLRRIRLYPAKLSDAELRALTAPRLGPELLVNGSFDSDTVWTKEAGWSIANGRAIHTGSTGTYIKQGDPIPGKVYYVVVDVAVANSTNFASVYLGQSPAIATITAPGVYTYMAASPGAGVLQFALRGVGDMEVNSFSVRAVLR